jgi:16S rRNA (adenine1518-N6/adenine1519-N6)-dimethyltransferase
MIDKKTIKQLLKERNLAPNKKLGQNFLVHSSTAGSIIDRAARGISGKEEIGKQDTLIEFGVGFGSLTRPAAERAGKIIGLEIDAGLIRWHEEIRDLPDNVIVLHQDLLKADLPGLSQECGSGLKIIANLPYSVSNPLLFKLIKNRKYLNWAVLMLQKEVAMRLTADIGSKQYGILSVLMAACGSVETLMDLGPEQFHPRPKVDSRVVRLIFKRPGGAVGEMSDSDFENMKSVVKASFQQRRKTILNSLFATDWFRISKNELGKRLSDHGLSPQIRPEKLDVNEFLNLSKLIVKIRKEIL